MFSLQQGKKTQTQLPLHYSSLAWDTSTLEQTKFQPFSQARGMMDSTPWSNRSNPPLYQLETPTAAQTLFGNPENYITEAKHPAEHQVTFSLHQPEDTEPVLDFTLHQAEREQQFQEDVFRGFSTEECGGDVSHVGRRKSKIYLKDETPATSSTPQTVPDSPGMEVELSNCTDMNCSCLQHNYGPMSGCDMTPSYPCAKGYLSSDSDDDRQCYHSCPSAVSSYMDQVCCEVSHNSNLGVQDNEQQRHIQSRLPTPPLKPQINLIDNQEVIEYMAGSDKGVGSNRQHTGSGTAQFESELCKCKKTSNETQDMGTQTDDKPKAETCDSSTQCSLVLHSATKATAPFDLPVMHPATRRQTHTTSGPNTQAVSTGNGRNGGKHMPWNNKKSRASSLSENKIINKFPAINSDGKGIPQRPINPFLDVLSMTYGKGEENREGKDERGQEENGRLMKDLSNEVREEVTCATKVNRLAEETQTLQEIADILLLLKQRKDE
nr:uncharacterized protein LOC109987655 isoform X1 [Labrus bergylta]